ncbi:hypothetical protein P154DRAFT_523834 [Amniculicola lignicola CBS 123094]|uniref:F-box domain-containing protein n=1 Tax=Amniculicola lignicola CBS 123094 TaxID=1392246 RepID=A0A6A5WF66_9PLEO|nr:hypothetical protein P154DRAFT_523834 [Amniculicola lignicola CBS 123094]
MVFFPQPFNSGYPRQTKPTSYKPTYARLQLRLHLARLVQTARRTYLHILRQTSERVLDGQLSKSRLKLYAPHLSAVHQAFTRTSNNAHDDDNGKQISNMPRFLNLPRELRDMVYLALITDEKNSPTLGEVQWLFRFRRVFEPQSSRWGEYGCAYSLEKMPRTCANLMACNRQVYEEMKEVVDFSKRKAMIPVKLDCIAEDESFHFFSWLSNPIVQTNLVLEEPCRIMPSWAETMIEKYLGSSNSYFNPAPNFRGSSTIVHQLWVDVRIMGDRAEKWSRNMGPADRTSWAVCAVLKRILEKGPDFSSAKDSGSTIIIEELVLNVVSLPNTPNEKYLPQDFPADGVKEGLVHPKTVAKELVDVWNRIWSADDFKGTFYQILLERIQRVRVCIDGETWRVRELRLELERGQAERRRIAARVGW